MESFRHIVIRGVAFLMIGVLGLLMSNKVFYLHTHRMDNGKIVVHAHPYHKSTDSKPFKIHHHSSVLSILLVNLEVFLIVAAFFGLLLNFSKSVFRNFIYHACFSIVVITHNGRAPPVS